MVLRDPVSDAKALTQQANTKSLARRAAKEQANGTFLVLILSASSPTISTYTNRPSLLPKYFHISFSTERSVCVFVCLSVNLLICLLDCLLVCLFVCLNVSLHFCPYASFFPTGEVGHLLVSIAFEEDFKGLFSGATRRAPSPPEEAMSMERLSAHISRFQSVSPIKSYLSYLTLSLSNFLLPSFFPSLSSITSPQLVLSCTLAILAAQHTDTRTHTDTCTDTRTHTDTRTD